MIDLKSRGSNFLFYTYSHAIQIPCIPGRAPEFKCHVMFRISRCLLIVSISVMYISMDIHFKQPQVPCKDDCIYIPVCWISVSFIMGKVWFLVKILVESQSSQKKKKEIKRCIRKNWYPICPIQNAFIELFMEAGTFIKSTRQFFNI